MIEIRPTDALVEISTLFDVWFPAPSVAVIVRTLVPSRSEMPIENAPFVVDRPLSMVPVVSFRTCTSISLSVFPVTVTESPFMISPGVGAVTVSDGALVSRTIVIGADLVPSTPFTTTTASITLVPAESGICATSKPAVFGILISAPVISEPSSRVMMMRMIASLLSSKSWGRFPKIVMVAAAVIGSLGSVRVGRPASSDAGGVVGDPPPPIEVMNGSAMAASPIAPAMTKRVMNVERAVAIVPPMFREGALDR